MNTSRRAEDSRPKEMPSPPFLAVHQYNPTSDEAQRQLLEVIAALNRAVPRTGLSQTQYAVWRVAGRQQGKFGYVLGSLWRDRATYEAVHEHPDYRKAVARFEEARDAWVAAERYNQYVHLNPGAPPALEEMELLAMAGLNLPTPRDTDRLLAILEAANEAIAEAGHPETQYDLWRIAEVQTGEFAYLLGHLWHHRKAYDETHRHPAFERFREQHGKELDVLLRGSVGNLYERLPVR